MINVASAKAALDALDGDQVVLSKAQFSEMLTEIGSGNAARRLLTNLRSIMSAGTAAAGLTMSTSELTASYAGAVDKGSQ